MTKFSTDFKLSVVKFYLENNVSKHEIARQFGVIKSEVIKWIALFENHGESGLRPRYTNYSQEFKIDVLNYMKDNGTSFRETAAIFNISSDATIGKWLKIVETHGVDALQPRKRGRLPMEKEVKKMTFVEDSKEALLAENERLRMENDYLKKLNALVQEKERLQNKTKHK